MWKVEKALKGKIIAYTEYKCIETENSEIVGHLWRNKVCTSEGRAQLTFLLVLVHCIS